MKRRTFLGLAGGTAALAVIPVTLHAVPTLPSRPKAKAGDALSWIGYSGGRYTLSLPRAEMGQNISTSLKQIACAELGVSSDQIDVIRADTGSIAPYRATVGSESIQDFALPLAQACAALREAVAKGAVGQIDITALPRSSLRAFRSSALPAKVALVDGYEIVKGQPLFVADISLPGMLYGRVLRSPVSPEIASRPISWDGERARSKAGFVAIVQDDTLTLNNSIGLGIVAETPGALDRIEAALSVDWQNDRVPKDNQVEADLDIDRRVRQGGAHYNLESDPLDASGRWDIDLRIDTPIAGHAAIEPRAAVADMKEGGGRLWVGSQDPFFIRATLGDRFGYQKSSITVIPMRIGGGFGGKVIPLAEIEAAALSRETGRPVKVQWTRAQEFAFAYHRPATSHRVRARVRNGRVRDWSHRMASGHVIYSNAVLPKWMQFFTDLVGDHGAARNLKTPYKFDAQAVGYDLARLPIRTAAWRGLGAAPNTLASEMTMEACARSARIDPIDFRMSHITDDRLRAVLSAVKTLAGPAPNKGRGIGCGIYKGVSYGAVIADVELKNDQTPYVKRLYCAHECGQVINADQVRAQCEGNLAWSIGMVLSDQLTMADGGISENDFASAPIPTIADLPPMEIALIESDAPPTGAGETLMASAPAAIANAFVSLTGKQPQRLPFTANDFRA